MKNTYLLYLIMILGYCCEAQIVTIKDADDNTPLEMVYLSSENPKAVAITNDDGQTNISAFKNAEKITIRILGHKTLVSSYQEIKSNKFVIKLQSSGITLDEVVITASRATQSSIAIPEKIVSISAKDIALQNPQTAADLLGSSGEVFIQKSQQGGGSPMIRGFSANRLLYVVDGVRMNTAIFRAGNLQNVISLDPFAIEKAEVQFGPGSVIYGSDALGGVMSFQTLTPQLSLNDSIHIAGKAVTRYSSANNEQTAHVDLNLGWKKWATLSSFSTHHFGDLQMGKYGPDDYLRPFYVQRIDNEDRIIENRNPRIQQPTSYRQTNLMQKIRFSPNEKWDLQYAFHYSETSDYSRYDRLIEIAPNELPRSAIWNYGPQKWMMNLLSAKYTNTHKLFDVATIRLSHQFFEESRIDRNFSGGNRFRLRTQTEQVQAYGINIDLEKTKGKHTFFYGTEFIQNDINSEAKAIDIRNNNDIPTPDRYPASVWNSYAVYLNYQYKLSPKTLVQSGIRYSHYSITSDFDRHLAFFPFDFTTTNINNNATTGSIGMVYSPDNHTKISFNASTGYRAPNVDDIGKIFDFTAGDVIVPNTTLKAEYAYNFDINLSKIINEWLKIDLTAYYTQLENAMVRRAFQVNGQDSIVYNGNMSKVYALQNAAKASVYGFHIGAEIKINERIALSSRYNYQKGIEEMEDGSISSSRHAAPAFGITRFIYKHKKINMQLYTLYSASIQHQDLNEEERQKPFLYAKDNNGDPYSPAWYTLNYKVMYQLQQHLLLNIGLENITNQRYRTYSSGIAAAGFNLIVSIKASF